MGGDNSAQYCAVNFKCRCGDQQKITEEELLVKTASKIPSVHSRFAKIIKSNVPSKHKMNSEDGMSQLQEINEKPYKMLSDNEKKGIKDQQLNFL